MFIVVDIIHAITLVLIEVNLVVTIGSPRDETGSPGPATDTDPDQVDQHLLSLSLPPWQSQSQPRSRSVHQPGRIINDGGCSINNFTIHRPFISISIYGPENSHRYFPTVFHLLPRLTRSRPITFEFEFQFQFQFQFQGK